MNETITTNAATGVRPRTANWATLSGKIHARSVLVSLDAIYR